MSTYTKYAEMFSKHGIKLKVPVSKELLNAFTSDAQSKIFDIIWAEQVYADPNISVTSLSTIVMDKIFRLGDVLLKHQAFKHKKYQEGGIKAIQKRANAHYTVDVRHTILRFQQRQDQIKKDLSL